MKNKPLIGILPFARPTFDVAFAEEKLAGMLAALKTQDIEICGPHTLLMDGATGRAAIAALKEQKPDYVLVLQVTFTDAVLAAEVGAAFDAPIGFWAPKEPRLGGRLRLNAFCGLNLAAHALGLRNRAFSWLFADPDEANIRADLQGFLSGKRVSDAPELLPSASPSNDQAAAVLAKISGAKIGRIGAHPDGFDTCAYDDAALKGLANITVEPIELGTLFDTARGVAAQDVAPILAALGPTMTGLDEVDGEQLDKSLRLKLALDAIRNANDYSAFAIRCWPETFTEYGGAICGPVSMQGENRIPCACEADVYGALSSLILQNVADAPVFLVDLVDMDTDDNTGVVWHCGQAPVSMCDADQMPEAAIHSNRKMPLLYQFPLKQGRVTLFRISQARGVKTVVIGGADMLKRPLAFTGTAGVLRFDADAETVTTRLMDAAFEHHMAICYGDHRETLRAIATALSLPVLDLTS